MSGLTCILAQIRNVPMVGLSEVNPDIVLVAAMLSMDHKSLREENKLYQVCMFCLLCQSVLRAHLYFPQDIV